MEIEITFFPYAGKSRFLGAKRRCTIVNKWDGHWPLLRTTTDLPPILYAKAYPVDGSVFLHHTITPEKI